MASRNENQERGTPRRPATCLDHSPAPKEHSPKACILGASLDVGNRGVLALGVAVARLLSRLSPSMDIVFHYGSRSGGSRRISQEGAPVTVRNCRMSLRSAPSEHILVILAFAILYRLGLPAPARRNAWLSSLIEADFIGDIRGGDSFSDIYGFWRFVLGSLPLLSVALVRRPYVMLPQTYGPFRWKVSRRLAGFMLRRASIVLTRDRNCERIVFELSGKAVHFCPDVAFALESTNPERVRIIPDGLPLGGESTCVGVNVSGLLYMGGYTQKNMFGLLSDYRETVDQLITAILTTTHADILLVPHVFGDEQEEEACLTAWRTHRLRHPGRVFALASPLNERELKWVIGKTDFFVGSRMHACIAALSQCVPTIGLAYSDKFLGVFESAGVGKSIVDLRTTPTNEVVARTLTAFARQSEAPGELESRIPGLQNAIAECFRGLLNLPSFHDCQQLRKSRQVLRTAGEDKDQPER